MKMLRVIAMKDCGAPVQINSEKLRIYPFGTLLVIFQMGIQLKGDRPCFLTVVFEVRYADVTWGRTGPSKVDIIVPGKKICINSSVTKVSP